MKSYKKSGTKKAGYRIAIPANAPQFDEYTCTVGLNGDLLYLPKNFNGSVRLP